MMRFEPFLDVGSLVRIRQQASLGESSTSPQETSDERDAEQVFNYLVHASLPLINYQDTPYFTHDDSMNSEGNGT